jgi:hypothetical protein
MPLPRRSAEDQVTATFLRGLTIGALVGAVLAGSSLLSRRRARRAAGGPAGGGPAAAGPAGGGPAAAGPADLQTPADAVTAAPRTASLDVAAPVADAAAVDVAGDASLDTGRGGP